MNYKIKLELFEGPLDLLLYLVKKDHLNITDIPITQVTEQYMQYLEVMKFLDLNIAGEFLVMAATLMQIKSKMLLPVDENQVPQEEEDPRADLIRQLMEYEKFKEIAETLRQRETEQRELFKRPKLDAPKRENNPSDPEYFEASIFDLITAFSHAMQDAPKELFYKVIKDEFTIEEKIHHLLHQLLVSSTIKVSELFVAAKNKIEVIVTFLAVLELIRMKEVLLRQKEPFGDIEIIRNEANILPDEKTETAQES